MPACSFSKLVWVDINGSLSGQTHLSSWLSPSGLRIIGARQILSQHVEVDPGPRVQGLTGIVMGQDVVGHRISGGDYSERSIGPRYGDQVAERGRENRDLRPVILKLA